MQWASDSLYLVRLYFLRITLSLIICDFDDYEKRYECRSVFTPLRKSTKLEMVPLYCLFVINPWVRRRLAGITRAC